VALAALGTYLVATRDGGGTRTSYAVATHDLAPGTTLGPADVELVPLELPPAQATGTFTDTALVLGGALRGPVRAGSVLTDALVERRRAPGQPPDETTAYREVSVAVPAANAVDGSLRPGDRVDVVATEGSASFVLVDRALVVASSGSDRGTPLGGGDVRVTLALPDAATALAVAHGAAAAELTLLRSTRSVDQLPDSYHLPGDPAATAHRSS
jgi:Flp pilus assembly protein CpaB